MFVRKKLEIEKDGVALRLCLDCKEYFPESEFSSMRNGVGSLQGHCGKCFLERGRGTGRINVLARIMVQLVSPCLDCGTTELIVMEFDHRDGGVNKYLNSDGTRYHAMSRVPNCGLAAEIGECDSVCASCHALRTHERREERKTPQPVAEREKCKIIFAWKMKQAKCNHCPREIDEKTSHVFHCDHIDPSTKINCPSKIAHMCEYTNSDMEEELKKCQLLCASCHRRKTAVDMEWPTFEDYKSYPIDLKIKAYKIFLDAEINKKDRGHFANHPTVKEFMGDAWEHVSELSKNFPPFVKM